MPSVVGGWRCVQAVFQKMLEKPSATLPSLSPFTRSGGTSNNPLYFATPVFYIADVGVAADGQGEAYQVDAVGYGGSANAVAVVESTYEVAKGLSNLGGL